MTRIDVLSQLEVWFGQFREEHHPEGSGPPAPKTHPISPVLVTDAMHEIQQLRRCLDSFAEKHPVVDLDEESAYCIPCRLVIHASEKTDHQHDATR